MAANVTRRKQQLVGHDPDINRVHVILFEVQLTMLAAGPSRKSVEIPRRQLIDVSYGIDVRQLSLQHKCTNDEVVVTVNVVSTSGPAEGLIAEHAHPPEVGATRLVWPEIEARVAGDDGLRVAPYIGRALAGGEKFVIAALAGAHDEVG